MIEKKLEGKSLENEEKPENRPVVIRLENVSKTFYVNEGSQNSIRERLFSFKFSNKKRAIKALHPIDLDIYKGEFFGIIGRNGSGKSTLLKLIMNAFPPDKGGNIEVHGRMIRLALGMGFDPNLSARENIYINASILGLSFKEIGFRFEEIIDFAGLSEFVDTKVKYYSSGMRSRLAFSIAVQTEADILLMDEFFGGVGDVEFKKKSDKIFKEYMMSGKTIIHVSHNLKTIHKYCNRVLVLDKGVNRIIGEPKEAIELYRGLFKNKKK